MRYLQSTVVVCVVVSGCVSANYQKVHADFLGNPMVLGDTPLVVLLDPVIPGKPFSETICDNAAGVTWNADESQHIGYTQDYATLFVKGTPQPGVSVPRSPGLINVDSRLMVPFGRLITENLKQAVGEAGRICEDQQCVSQARQQWPNARLIEVTFKSFRVAEEDRNKLLLEVDGEARATGGQAAPRSATIHTRINESVAHGGASNMLRNMNVIANASTTSVVNQVLAAGR